MMAAFWTPLELFTRPLEVLQLDCLRQVTNTNLATKDYAQLACVTIPIAFGTIAACHILEGLYGYTNVALTEIPRWIRDKKDWAKDAIKARRRKGSQDKGTKKRQEDLATEQDDASSTSTGMES